MVDLAEAGGTRYDSPLRCAPSLLVLCDLFRFSQGEVSGMQVKQICDEMRQARSILSGTTTMLTSEVEQYRDHIITSNSKQGDNQGLLVSQLQHAQEAQKLLQASMDAKGAAHEAQVITIGIWNDTWTIQLCTILFSDCDHLYSCSHVTYSGAIAGGPNAAAHQSSRG